jgi:hypothetical protein
MKNSDSFLKYTADDLKYEFWMLNQCRNGLHKYKNKFLFNLCLEGWLLHTRRIIESFQLQTIDKDWKRFWGLISQHLSHAKPANRSDPRSKNGKNPKWDINKYHPKLVKDIEAVAEKYKSEYSNYDLLIEILRGSNK